MTEEYVEHSGAKGQSRSNVNLLRRVFEWNLGKKKKQAHLRLPHFYLIMSSIVINLLSLMLPIMTMQTYDRVIPHKSYETLSMLVILVFVCLVLEMILRLVRSYLLGWAGAVFEHKSFCEAINQLLKADITELDKKATGNYINTVNTIPKLKDFYSGQALMLMIDVPFLFVYLGIMWFLGTYLVIVPMVIFVVVAVLVRLETASIFNLNDEKERYGAQRISFFIEVMNGIHTVKSLGTEMMFQRRYDKMQDSASRINYVVAIANGKTINIVLAASQFMTVAVATVGAILVMNGIIGLGGMSACILLSGRLMQPIQRSVTFLHRLNEYHLAQEKVDSVFDLSTHHTSNKKIKDPQGNIVISHVDMPFRDTPKKILSNFSATIKAKSCIGLSEDQVVSGHALLNLIAGVISPSQGKILVDNVDPYQLSIDQYAQVIGYLKAKGPIFQGTIRENLTFFGAIKDEDAEEMATNLGIDVAIGNLPLGYETPLFDNHSDLISPGIKQRVALARVLASNPQIILFDHADTSLDFEGVRLLYEYLESIKKERTIILLSNNKRMLKLCNKHYEISAHGLTPISTRKGATS